MKESQGNPFCRSNKQITRYCQHTTLTANLSQNTPHIRVQAITDFDLHEIRVSWPCRKNFQLSSFFSPSPPALPTPDHQYRDTFLCAALPSTLSLVCAHEQKETWSSFGFWTHCQLEMWYQWTSQEHFDHELWPNATSPIHFRKACIAQELL